MNLDLACFASGRLVTIDSASVMMKYNYSFIAATDDVGELTAELVEKMEHFKVGQEKVSALKTVAIKLEVSNKRINYKSLNISITDLILSLDLGSPQSLLPSDISRVSNEETERGGVKADISAQGCSLGQVSPFFFTSSSPTCPPHTDTHTGGWPAMPCWPRFI